MERQWTAEMFKLITVINLSINWKTHLRVRGRKENPRYQTFFYITQNINKKVKLKTSDDLEVATNNLINTN